MTQRSKSAFNTTYADSAGTFADNTTRAISEADMRQFSQDIKDSCLFELDTNLSQIVSTKITVSSAEILALNGTPKTLLSAQGSGTFIKVIDCLFFLDYNSVAYATNTDFEMKIGSGQIMTSSGANYFANVADAFYQYVPTASYSVSYSYPNQALTLAALGGNPTAGNSPLYVYLTYRIITL